MIKMIAGVYGMRVVKPDGSVNIKAMGPESGSFSLVPHEESRLVGLGVARYVDTPDGRKPVEELNARELRELGKEYGLTFRVGMRKDEMAAMLKAAMENVPDPDGDDSKDDDDIPPVPPAPPVEDVEDEVEPADEDAPTFDAAEAVQ